MSTTELLPDLEIEPSPSAVQHQLKSDVVSLRQSIVIGIATSAPGQATAVALSAIVATSAYASGPAIFISLIPMLAIALCYQRLNKWEQNCGGPYVWVARAISPYVGYLVGWAMLVGLEFGAISSILPLGPSLLSFVGINASGRAGNFLLITIFGLVLTFIAAVGIKVTARFQMLFASIEILILLVFSCIAFWAVFIGHWRGTVHPSMSWLHVSGVGGKGDLAATMLIGIFLFSGWDVSVYIGEETHRKRTNPGRAVLTTVAILGPLYAWLFVCFQGVVSNARLQAHAGTALPYVAAALVGSTWSKVMIFAIVLSVLGTTQATILATSRITYSMGTDRLLPKMFGRIHPKHETPFRAAMFWGVVMVAIADLYVLFTSLANAFDDVVNGLAIAFAVFWIFTALSTTIYYRKVVVKSLREFLLVGAIPLAGAACLSWVLVRTIPTMTTAGRWTLLGIAAVGIVLMLVSAFILRSPFFKTTRSHYEPIAKAEPVDVLN